MKFDIKAIAGSAWSVIYRYFTKPWFLILLALLIGGAGLIYKYASEPPPPSDIYTIALDPSWSPLPVDDRSDDITIFSEEILRAIAAEENLPIEIQERDAGDLFLGLENGDFQGVLSTREVFNGNTNFTPDEVAQKFAFSEPYYNIGSVLVVSTVSHIKSLKDLEGKSIGIISDSEPIMALYKIPQINIHYYTYGDRFQLAQDVSNNVINAMVLSMIPAYEYTEGGLYRGKLKIASKPLTQDGLRLFVINTPGTQTFLLKFNKGLEKIKKNGTYDRLLRKWNLFGPGN